jgi:peptide alpha-N-acetyltransferase
MKLNLISSLLAFTRLPYLFGLCTKKDSNFKIRFAKREDIESINKCNIENLPENYSNSFYVNHLNKWPELSLIAENEEKKIIGYALARVESPPQTENFNYNNELLYNRNFKQNQFGHIASLAVYSEFRGKGIAQSLMKSLHYNLVQAYNIDKACLYCRV